MKLYLHPPISWLKRDYCLFFTLTLILFLVSSCKDKEEEAKDNAPAPDPTNIEVLKDRPEFNQFILTSKDETLVKVDPNTGIQENLFSFNDYDDVESVDFADGIIYAGAGDNSINAIELQSRKLLWDIPLTKYESSALAHPQVVIDESLAYASGIQGVLIAGNIYTGKICWAFPLDPTGDTDGYYSLVGKPTITQDKIIIGTSSNLLTDGDHNFLYAIDKKTGKLIWKKQLPDKIGISGSIKLVGKLLLVPAHSLFAMDVDTGEIRWEFKMEELSRGAGSPVVSGDKVLVQGASKVAEGRLYCINLTTGTKIWEINAGNDYSGVYAPLVVGDFVFGVYERGSSLQTTGNGKPFMANISTGKIVWVNDEISVKTSPVQANGRLFFHGANFEIKGGIDNSVGFLSLEAASGKFLWLNNYFRYSSGTTPIVVANNGIFRSGSYSKM